MLIWFFSIITFRITLYRDNDYKSNKRPTIRDPSGNRLNNRLSRLMSKLTGLLRGAVNLYSDQTL